MRLAICAVGCLKKTPFEEAFWFYQRRLTWSLSVLEVNPKFPASMEPSVRQQRETELLLQGVPGGFLRVILDPFAKDTSSEALSELLATCQRQAISPAFLIGGAEGFSASVLDKTPHQTFARIAFGKATWPHLLVRVMLIEQLYRAQQILKNHPYHRGSLG
ncbi:MAG: 23S rRNA (pseudouridine(1915)-N(3))-methyltransferase RlmH [Alphaproteobacteria bacterium]